MGKYKKLLIIFSILSLPGLMFAMIALGESVSDMYDTWGEGLHYKTLMVPVVACTPIPTVIAMLGTAVLAIRNDTDRLLRFLAIIFWIQAAFFLCVPVLLALLENELNAPVVYGTALLICLSCALASLFSFVRKDRIL